MFRYHDTLFFYDSFYWKYFSETQIRLFSLKFTKEIGLFISYKLEHIDLVYFFHSKKDVWEGYPLTSSMPFFGI